MCVCVCVCAALHIKQTEQQFQGLHKCIKKEDFLDLNDEFLKEKLKDVIHLCYAFIFSVSGVSCICLYLRRLSNPTKRNKEPISKQ